MDLIEGIVWALLQGRSTSHPRADGERGATKASAPSIGHLAVSQRCHPKGEGGGVQEGGFSGNILGGPGRRRFVVPASPAA